MRFIPQTMLGRTLAVVVGGILLVQVMSGIFHYSEWRTFSENSERSKLIERMATYVQWMNQATPLQREFLLRSNRSKLRAWQTPDAVIKELDNWFGIEAFVRDRLGEALGDIDKKRIRVSELEQDQQIPENLNIRKHNLDQHRQRVFGDRPLRPRILVAVQLDDGAWLNMILPYRGLPAPPVFPFVIPLLAFTLVVALVAVLMTMRANKPLTRMAKAAEQLGRDVNAPPMSEEGPREVREAAHAFNEMQTRLRRFVQDRTNMLAAISHDLRTPITRMKLRAEFVEDDEQRDKMLSDLNEMEAMIKATMAFARDDVAHEAVSSMDLAALVESLCEDRREMGGDVTYIGPDELPFKGRPMGLKRALDNLVSNALKYATTCTVTLSMGQDAVVLVVTDNGPGIPEEELEEVFRPFRRVEGSRNKETGGVGLGLAVVRSVCHAHGGTATLKNLPNGGLEATLVLPL
jgi:signal transduction histidine kinase